LPRDRRHANRERLRRVLPAAALACLLCIAFAASAQGAGPAPAIRLVVAGSVESKQVLGLSDLRALPVRRVEDQRQVRLGGSVPAEPAAVRSYTGVLLRDIVAAAKPTEDGRHELRRSVVVVTASDGYRVVFSWAELFLSPIGDGAIVVFERDGTPLAANEGPLAVVSLRDIQPGPRHVKWLEKIELRRID
jgi:DMSO/TMAO reductase YedYZ molybdopterin-dependent catalytic subunit